MASTTVHDATGAAVAAARTAQANRFEHLYSTKAPIGAGDWAQFRGDSLVAEWDPKAKRTEIYHSVNGDGKTPNKSTLCTINIPPMWVKFNPTLEGNVFTRSKPEAAKQWKISRAKAKWRLAFYPGVVSDKLATEWEQTWPADKTPVPLEQVHAEFVAELVAAQKKIMRDAMHSPDVGLRPHIEAAKKTGRAIVKARPEHATKSEAQFDTEIMTNPELKKQVADAAAKQFVDGAALQGVEVQRTSGDPLPPRFIVQSSVYKVERYGNGYDPDAKGPGESELPSTLDNMPRSIALMRGLGNGNDPRTYQMIQFANARYASSSPKYLLHRPEIPINGEQHPNYAWDPLNKSRKGTDLKPWVSISMAPRIMASDKSYGVQFTLMGKRQVAIFHQEELTSEPASHFAAGIGSGLYEDPEDDDEQPVKRERTDETPDEPTDAAEQPAKRTRTDAEPAAAVPEEDPMAGLFD